MSKLRIQKINKKFVVQQSMFDYRHQESFETWFKMGLFDSLKDAEEFCENYIQEKTNSYITIKEYTY